VSAPRAELRARIRPLLGMGEEADKLADRVVAAFSVVELRDQDIDVTTLAAPRRQLLRQPWIVAALANGPGRVVEGEDLLDDFGHPAGGDRD
jgi:hypothetical protein